MISITYVLFNVDKSLLNVYYCLHSRAITGVALCEITIPIPRGASTATLPDIYMVPYGSVYDKNNF